DDPESKSRLAALVEGLQQLGWSEGRNLHIDIRWGSGDADSFRRQAAELVTLAVQSRSVVESAMLMLHSGRPYGTDSSRQRQDHPRRPSCYTAIECFDPRARQPLRSESENGDEVAQARLPL